MASFSHDSLDVAVIGGGPAGVVAAGGAAWGPERR
jgi:succinate dehydrogenase/fumarate reductase flavoprotein subunit